MGINIQQISNKQIARFRADFDHLRQIILPDVIDHSDAPIEAHQGPFRNRGDQHKSILAILTEFREEVARVAQIIATKHPHPTTPKTSSLSLDHRKLCGISKQFAETMKRVMEQARNLHSEMLEAWPGDPRLCTESVLLPFDIQNKEVPLTRALAWLMTPRDRLGKDFLAAFVSMVVPEKNADVSNWDVSAEEPSETEDGCGRIDIQLHGKVDSMEQVIGIEAKISADESANQLPKYHASLRGQFPNANITIVFLTKDGRNSKTLPSAQSMSYAHLLEAWLPILRVHDKKNDCGDYTQFARLLLADVARYLAATHLGELGKYGLPRGLEPKQWMKRGAHETC